MIILCNVIIFQTESNKNTSGCREIDFVNEKVRTLAGNGTKGSDYSGGGKGAAQVNVIGKILRIIKAYTGF